MTLEIQTAEKHGGYTRLNYFADEQYTGYAEFRDPDDARAEILKRIARGYELTWDGANIVSPVSEYVVKEKRPRKKFAGFYGAQS